MTAAGGGGRAGPGLSALMEDEDCPDLVPIGADGAEQTEGSPGRKIPVTIVTGYLGEERECRAAGPARREGRAGQAAGAGLQGGGLILHTDRASSAGPAVRSRGVCRAAPSSSVSTRC